MATVPQDATQDVQFAVQELNQEIEDLRFLLRDVAFRAGQRDPELITRAQLDKRLAKPKHLDFTEVFRAAGPAHSIGYVPSTAPMMSGAYPEGHERVLREDAVWRMPTVQGPFKTAPDDPHDKYNIQGHLHVAGGLYASKLLAGGDSDVFGDLRVSGALTGGALTVSSIDGPLHTDIIPMYITLVAGIPVSTINLMQFRRAGTITEAYAKRLDGTTADVNIQNASSDIRSADLTLSGTGWTNFDTLQNTTVSVGNALDFEVAAVTGTITQLSMYIVFTYSI
jgi:hypothetical protein